MKSYPTLLNHDKPIDYHTLIDKQEVLVIDDFYRDLSWFEGMKLENTQDSLTTEKIFYPNKDFRHELLRQVSQLFPGAIYPTDAGWIRSTIKSDVPIPINLIHSDHPYLVLSVCLSSQPDEEKTPQGTTFYRHKDLGFKSLFNHRMSGHFKNIFSHHRNNKLMWEPWFTYEFKKNRAIIYSGSLLHNMPLPGFGSELSNSRLMQIFNFRIPQKGFHD